jgi:hypothetical protein
MQPTQLEIILDAIKQGESVTLEFTYRYKADGTLIDMTSYTMTLTVKNDPDGDDADITKLDATWTKAEAAQGVVSITLSATETAALDPEIYHIEAKAVSGTTVIKTKKDIKLPVLKSIE